MDIKGTISEQNIKSAFCKESQARNKYTYYAVQARKLGHDDIADLFEKMANNEKEHARVWFNMLYNSQNLSIEEMLADAANDEKKEWMSIYPDFAEQARKDGLEDVAKMFDMIAAIENDHERRFINALLEHKTPHTHSAKEAEIEKESNQISSPYVCVFCGHTASTQVDVCPVCKAVGSYEKVEE